MVRTRYLLLFKIEILEEITQDRVARGETEGVVARVSRLEANRVKRSISSSTSHISLYMEYFA